MKKMLIGIAAFITMAILCIVSAGAETYGDLNYYVLDDGTVEITGYTGSATELEIPAQIDGKTVTSIGDWAFNENSLLTSISLPNTIINIGDYSFNRCSSLTAITIPDSVTNIGAYAFAGCSFTSVTIPESVTNIGESTFYTCYSLTSVILPESITSLSDSLFSCCTSLKSITIPDSVTSIGDSAFYKCQELAFINIPDSVTSIGDSAFYYCKELTSISIPASVISIEGYAFYECTSLTSINVDSANEHFTSANGVLFDKNKTTLIAYPAGKTDTNYNVPDSITSIGNYAFYGCTSLTSITIPSSVTNIGANAFYNTALYDNQTTDLKYADKWLIGYTGKAAQNVAIKDGTLGIADFTFMYSSIDTLEIPESLKYISDSSFSYYNSFLSITVDSGNNYFTASDGVLFNKDKTTLFIYPSKKNGANYTVPSSVRKISDFAFMNSESLTSITIPYGVTSIGDSSFDGCASVTSINLPDSIKSIGLNAFRDCSSLTSINLPDSIKSIGSNTFSGCSSLTSITVPDSVMSIGDWAFWGCSSLTSITIPESVPNIGDYAFYYCSSLTSITIPDSVTSIGDRAFSDCYGLTSVTIPNSVTSIGDKAFYCCYGLTSVTIPDSVTSIGQYAFDGCIYLTSVTIPDSVTSIGQYAFDGCSEVVISCYENSVAHQYAVDNEIEYKLIPTELAPSVLSATAGDKQATLSWTAVDGASYYQIIRYNKGNYSLIANISGTTATVKGLTNGFEYTYLIKAVAADGRTSFSNAVAVTPVAALAKPTLSATAGNAQATLSWTAVDGASYYQIIRYNKGNYSLIANISGTSATVKGLTNNFEYTYLVKAVAADGRTSFSNAVAVTPVAALAKPVLSATAGDKQATLSWTAVSGASYYQIIRYNAGNYTLIANISGTSATVKGLTNNFEYTYLVKAVAADGRTSFSNAVAVTPVAAVTKPTLSATAGNAQATLSWTAVSGASYYQIIRYNNGTYSVVANVSTTSATVKGLTNDYEYTYLIKAVAADGRTSFSNTVNVTPVAALAKTTLSATAGNAQATLSWTAVDGASYYQIIRYNNGTYSVVANVSTTSATVKGLANNYAYTYLIKAVAADGTSSFSNAVTVTPHA